MKLIDLTVPLDALPVCPGNTPLSLEPIKRIAQRVVLRRR
jgi:kynurenine formamidase